MPIAGQKFDLYAGDAQTIDFDLEEGAPDLTGGGAEFWLGTSPQASGDQVKLKRSTAVDGDGVLLLLDTATNRYKVTVVLPGNSTRDLRAQVYYFQVNVFEAGGKSHVVATGTATIIPTMRA